MKNLSLLLLLIAITPLATAQTGSVKKVLKRIDIQQDTIKSIYDWITDNISYDVSKLNSIQKQNTSKSNKNNLTYTEHKAALLEKVISRKKGVCEDYSILFDALVKELGYESKVVEGYTRNEKGRLQDRVGHTWNAVKVDNVWKLYDPTWGAGYVKNGTRYIKKTAPKWYDINAEEMIKTHMPYDPIWQLSEFPISYKDFENKNTNKKSQVKTDYTSEISLYFSKPEKIRLKDQIRRSKELGNGIRLIAEWRKFKQHQIVQNEISTQPVSLEEANENITNAGKEFKNYVNARNNQFRSKKYTKTYAKKSLAALEKDIRSTLGVYRSFDVSNANFKKVIRHNIINSERLLNRVEQELRYLNK